MSRSCAGALLALVLATAPGAVLAQEPAPDSQVPPKLDEARRLVEARRFERALPLLRAVIETAEAAEDPWVEAMALRARAEDGRGRPAAAEGAYREILRLRPGFEPAPGEVSKKLMARFVKIRDATVGTVRVETTPAIVELLVDGGPSATGPDGRVRLLAGTHTFRASRAGFDPAETIVEVEAGTETAIRLDLDPNARTLVVRTRAEGVRVRVDGREMGVSERPATAERDAFPELRLEGVALGQHVLELELPCHRTETIRTIVSADLLDLSPRIVGPVELERVGATVALRGGPEGAAVFLDGVLAGSLPIPTLTRCPGPTVVEVRSGGRTVWRAAVDLEAGAGAELDVRPRPNAALVGGAEWPDVLRGLGAVLGTPRAVTLPPGSDPMGFDTWKKIAMPADVDLALAPLPVEGGEPRERWALYSPVLGTVETLVAPPPSDRPDWIAGTIGVDLVDSRNGGTARVIATAPGGPAARAGVRVGDRIVQVGEAAVAGSREALAAIGRSAVARAAITIRLEAPAGDSRRISVMPTPTARRADLSGAPGSMTMAAAWARVDAAVLGADEAAAALANLAWLLGAAGRHAEAAAAWGEVLERRSATVCAGAASYRRGVELEAAGRASDASEAFRVASRSDCPSFGDSGVRVALAARQRIGAATAR